MIDVPASMLVVAIVIAVALCVIALMSVVSVFRR